MQNGYQKSKYNFKYYIVKNTNFKLTLHDVGTLEKKY